MQSTQGSVDHSRRKNDSRLDFDTAQIAALRGVVARFSELRAAIGDIVQFRVIVDANFVIQTLIHRVRFPARGATATAIEELVRATVLDVVAPRWLESELVSAIPKASKRSKVSEAEL
jgi:hypothetical protein